MKSILHGTHLQRRMQNGRNSVAKKFREHYMELRKFSDDGCELIDTFNEKVNENSAGHDERLRSAEDGEDTPSLTNPSDKQSRIQTKKKIHQKKRFGSANLIIERGLSLEKSHMTSQNIPFQSTSSNMSKRKGINKAR